MNAASTNRYVEVIVHEDEGTFWAESPQMPRWTAAADTYEELEALCPEAFRFVLGEGSYAYFIHRELPS